MIKQNPKHAITEEGACPGTSEVNVSYNHQIVNGLIERTQEDNWLDQGIQLDNRLNGWKLING